MRSQQIPIPDKKFLEDKSKAINDAMRTLAPLFDSVLIVANNKFHCVGWHQSSTGAVEGIGLAVYAQKMQEQTIKPINLNKTLRKKI